MADEYSQAMSPSSRETLRETRCDLKPLGYGKRTSLGMGNIAETRHTDALKEADEVTSWRADRSGLGVYGWHEAKGAGQLQPMCTATHYWDESLVTVREKEESLTHGAGAVGSRTLVAVSDEIVLKEAICMICDLVDSVGNWIIRDSKAYIFLDRGVGAGGAEDDCNGSHIKRALTILELAEQKGWSVLRYVHQEDGQRGDTVEVTGALTGRESAEVCVFLGKVVAGDIHVSLAELRKCVVPCVVAGQFVQSGRLDVHSAAVGGGRSLEESELVDDASFRTFGDFRRDPEYVDASPKDLALPNGLEPPQTCPTRHVKVAQSTAEACPEWQMDSISQGELQQPMPGCGLVTDGLCKSGSSLCGQVGSRIGDDQGRGCVSGERSSFRLDVYCQGPAVCIDPVGQMPSIATSTCGVTGDQRNDFMYGQENVSGNDFTSQDPGSQVCYRPRLDPQPVPQPSLQGIVRDVRDIQPIGFRPDSLRDSNSPPIRFRPGSPCDAESQPLVALVTLSSNFGT